MAGGRGAAPCGREGCGGARVGIGGGKAAVGERAWLPRARWLARRLAALLVLLALVAAGCVLRRRACSASRRRRLPTAARRRVLPAPGPGPSPTAPPLSPGSPTIATAPEQRPWMELPPLPRYEKVKHLPSYEEAQRWSPHSPGNGEGESAVEPLDREPKGDVLLDAAVAMDGMLGILG